MIEIDGLTKAFGTETVVDHVSFAVGGGEVAVLVGTSGAGKTTLLRMINRLIEPSSGRVLIDGRDTLIEPAHLLRRRIGYAIQGHGLFPHRTVAQNIGTVPQLVGWDRARIARRVDELLDLFGLDPAAFRDRMPAELSGGQQQRVGVARALAAEPALLLMDEPFAALDPILRQKARDDLKAIQRRLGTTILLVTHDMDEAMQLGDRIAVMAGGKLVQYGPPAEIISRPATPFVEAMVGASDRALKLLSLRMVSAIVEPGEAAGPAISENLTLRDALSEALWSCRDALPVTDAAGRPMGRVTLNALQQAARPQ